MWELVPLEVLEGTSGSVGTLNIYITKKNKFINPL